MEPRVAALAAILDLNTGLLLNCLDQVSEAEAKARPLGGCNSIAFLSAHLADSRHFLAARLGSPLENPLAGFLASARTIDDLKDWPTLEEIARAWVAISAHLQSALEKVSGVDLDTPNAHRFPIADTSRLGMIAFLTQHDSYHLGQAALLRRQLGRPAMSYARGGRSSPA